MNLRRLASGALLAGIASVSLWLASYSWIIGAFLEVDEAADDAFAVIRYGKNEGQ